MKVKLIGNSIWEFLSELEEGATPRIIVVVDLIRPTDLNLRLLASISANTLPVA